MLRSDEGNYLEWQISTCRDAPCKAKSTTCHFRRHAHIERLPSMIKKNKCWNHL